MKTKENYEIYKDKKDNEYLNNFSKENEIISIKEMINSMHKDLKKMIENSNQDYLNLMYSNLKNEFINSINGYMIDKIDPVLDKRMINSCDMKNQCKKVFKKYLKTHTDDLNIDNITNEKIYSATMELNEIKKNKFKDDCDICFNEVSAIFNSNIDLINSFKIYDEQDEQDEKKISEINENVIVKNILDPISNKHRLKILKSIALEPQTFSALSQLTNLKGGNLLFHLQKLQGNDFIFQKQEHGEYILTTKGFNIINTVVSFQE
ncbi:MAG: winged helix-turn-helix domain-containing protein [Methanobrevibacter sp.]|jgi:DNA-binding HxlR family transcriptional regulator|nr:winged helix-turn-helix domain-containing protein [Candidatus Methanovirga meridionalis]